MVLSHESYKWFYDHIHCHYYDLLIKWCFLPSGGEKKVRKELISHIRFSPGEKILDMCCGTGGATFSIARQAGENSDVVGMDLSSGQLEHARRRNRLKNVRFVQGDVTRTGLERGSFDKVFITHALHEMSRETRLQTLAEARNLLRQNGELIVLELDNPDNILVRLFMALWFFYWLPFNFETPTRKDMLKHGVVEEVEEAGFRNVTKTSKFHHAAQVVQGLKQS